MWGPACCILAPRLPETTAAWQEGVPASNDLLFGDTPASFVPASCNELAPLRCGASWADRRAAIRERIRARVSDSEKRSESVEPIRSGTVPHLRQRPAAAEVAAPSVDILQDLLELHDSGAVVSWPLGCSPARARELIGASRAEPDGSVLRLIEQETCGRSHGRGGLEAGVRDGQQLHATEQQQVCTEETAAWKELECSGLRIDWMRRCC